MTTARKTSTRLLSATAAGLLGVGLLTGCSGDDTADSPADDATSAVEADKVADVPDATYPGVDGETALDLLLEYDPDAEVVGEGEMAFVVTIDGYTAADGEEFWGLYVDGEMAQVGAGSLETADGQEIRWTLEEIE